MVWRRQWRPAELYQHRRGGLDIRRCEDDVAVDDGLGGQAGSSSTTVITRNILRAQ
jgi:hypothetical protein